MSLAAILQEGSIRILRQLTTSSGDDVRYRKGERVVARRDFEPMNRPTVPKGAEGEVVDTTLFTGRPKTVLFRLMTEWGPATFRTYVERNDVGRPQPS